MKAGSCKQRMAIASIDTDRVLDHYMRHKRYKFPKMKYLIMVKFYESHNYAYKLKKLPVRKQW